MSVQAAPCRPSRLPLHNSRPSRLPSPTVAVAGTPAFCHDVNKENERLTRRKGTQVEVNRKLTERRQGVAVQASPARPQQQRRRASAGPVDVVMPGDGSHGNGVVSNEMKCLVRPINSPSCGVRMSELRSAERQQVPPSPTISVRSSSSSSSTAVSDRLTVSTRLSHEPAVCLPPRRTAAAAGRQHGEMKPAHFASTSSVDSVRSTDRQHGAPAVNRRPTKPPATSPSVDVHRDLNRPHSRASNNSNASRSRLNLQKSEVRRSIYSSESNESLSPRSDCARLPVSRRAPTAQDEKHRRRSDCSDKDSSYQARSPAGSAEPKRHYCRLSRSPESDADELSDVRSMSTITSIESSSSSSTATLTDDADESAAESTAAASRNNRRRTDRGRRDSAGVPPSPSPSYRHSDNARNTGPTQPSTGYSRRVSSSSSSSELHSPVSPASSRVVSRERPGNHLQDIQRVGNFGMVPRPASRVSKQNARPPVAPPPQPQKSRSELNVNSSARNRATAAPCDKIVIPSRPGFSRSPRQLPPERTHAVAKPAGHSSSVVAPVSKHRSSSGGSVQLGSSPNIKSPNSPSHTHVQARQIAPVKKAASTARVSAAALPPKSPTNHVAGNRSSSAGTEMKRVAAVPSPLQTAAGTASMRPPSKIPSASHDQIHRPGNSTRFHRGGVADENSAVPSDRRKLAEKSARHVTAAAIASCGAIKSTKGVVKLRMSPESRTVDDTDIRSAAGMPKSPCAKTQTPALRQTVSTDSHQTPIRHPPLPPSRIKRPSSVHGVAAAVDRRPCAGGNRQRRPLSADCLAPSSGRQQPSREKSDSCTDAVNMSASMEHMMSATNAANGNNVVDEMEIEQLTKSYDCIASLSSNLDRRKYQDMCTQSTTSLVDVMSPRLVKPYSAINSYSAFGRRLSASKKDHHSTTATDGCRTDIKTQRSSSDVQSAVQFQSRSSGLPQVPEIDEFECDRTPSTDSTVDMLTADVSRTSSDEGRQQLTAEGGGSPNIQQKPYTGHKYRAEYSTFLVAAPQQSDNIPTVQTTTVPSQSSRVEATGTNVSGLLHQQIALTTSQREQNRNDMHENHLSKITLPESWQLQEHSASEDEHHRPDDRIRSDDDFRISTARPSTLSAESSTVEDVPIAVAAVESSSAENYIVTYESDNIVVLDREPVIDCLTPEVDVVTTDVSLLYGRPTTGGGITVTADGGNSRTLPLSESGYDTWKSSQGSVSVSVNSCVMSLEPDAQQQHEEKDRTLRMFEHRSDSLKIVDMQTEHIISEKENADKDGYEISQSAGDGMGSSLLFRPEDNVTDESTTSARDAADTAGANDAAAAGDGESACRRHDNADDADVEDSGAQMFTSICLDAAQSVTAATGASRASTPPCLDNGSSTLISPGDSVAFGLTDPNICFSPQTIQPAADSDILLHGTLAHLGDFQEMTQNTCLSSPATDDRQRDSDVEARRTSDDVAAGLNVESVNSVAGNLARNTSSDFCPSKNCIDDNITLIGNGGISSEASLPSAAAACNDSGPVPPYCSTAVSDVVAETESLDTYETICDDLLESMETNVSDSESSHLSPPSCQAAAPCSADTNSQLNAKLSESSEEMKGTNERDAAPTQHLKVSVQSSNNNDSSDSRAPLSSVSSTQSTSSIVSSTSPSTAVAGRLPVMTLRRVRTNFSVVYRQQQSHSVDDPRTAAVSSRQSAHIEADHDKLFDKTDGDSAGTVLGCRRALAVLASRLHDHNRRQALETNVSGAGARSRASLQTGPNVTPGVSWSSKVTPAAATSTHDVLRDHKAAAWNKKSDLQSTKNESVTSTSTCNVQSHSKLPLSTTQSAPSSGLKKPSTFRKLFSTKLTSAVRRTQTKHN